MTPDELIVRQDDHEEVATVEETVETNSTTYARVEGLNLSGWVEVPENPASPVYVLVCEDCGREDTVGEEDGPLRKENRCDIESNAEGLKHTHEILRPTHNPRVEVRA